MLQSCHCFKVWERDQKISISWIFNIIYLRFDINNSKINCGSLCFIRSQTFFIHSSINSSLKGLSWEVWFRIPKIRLISISTVGTLEFYAEAAGSLDFGYPQLLCSLIGREQGSLDSDWLFVSSDDTLYGISDKH